VTTRGIHDIGGLPAGPVDPSHHDAVDWERMAVAVNNALGPRGVKIIRVDERRRTTEDMGESYNKLAYYERAVLSNAKLLVEKVVLSQDEIQARMAKIRARRGNSNP
jgi:hypothetical protein